MDSIRIRGLRLDAHIGVDEEERARAQILNFDIDIDADLDTAARSDDIDDTVDYADAVNRVAEVVEATQAHLLERLAADVAETIATMKHVRGVTVEVAKDPPPVEENVTSVSVRIERQGS